MRRTRTREARTPAARMAMRRGARARVGRRVRPDAFASRRARRAVVTWSWRILHVR